VIPLVLGEGYLYVGASHAIVVWDDSGVGEEITFGE
jgi:hypothetical protein